MLTGFSLVRALFLMQYAISQLNKLEDSIWERWTRKKPQERSISMYLNKHTNMCMCACACVCALTRMCV